MYSIEEVGKIIFNGLYWEGGNDDGNFKAPFNNVKPKNYEYASKRYKYLCGVLPTYVICEDYDSDEIFERRVAIAKARNEKCIAIKGASKGGHIFFFNKKQVPITNNSGNKTLLTFSPVDYKLGIKQVKSTGEIKPAKACASVSKEDGSLREVIYCSTYEDGSLDEIPYYDYPLVCNTRFEGTCMVEGDGRQDFFFRYMNVVKSEGYSYEQYVEMAEIINNHVFTEPLNESDYNSGIREDAWEGAASYCESMFFTKDGKFLHNIFGDYLIEKYHVKKINGYIHMYKEGVYVPGYDELENMILNEIPSLTKVKRNEVLDYLRIRVHECDRDSDLSLIAFKNGIYDVKTNSFKEFDPQYIITNRIPWNYNSEAKSELIDNILDKLSCGDKEIRYLIEELAGACMYRSNALGGGKAAILVGDKSNGKSTYLNILKAMLGRENYSVLDIKDLGNRFDTMMLYGKLANLGDDISNKYIDDTSVFKKIATGEEIKAEEKGKKPFNFEPYSTLIFSANEIPRTADASGATSRRLLIVPFNGKFTKDSPDYNPSIRYDVQKPDHMEYFIQLALDGLNEVLRNKDFTTPTKVKAQKEIYERENNPILAFIDEDGVDNIVNQPTKDVYRRYQVFCSDNGFVPCSNMTFSKKINKELGTKTDQKKINGQKFQIFLKVQD